LIELLFLWLRDLRDYIMIILSKAIITMKLIHSSFVGSSPRRSVSGFSLIEAVVLVGAIAATTGVGVVAVHHTREVSQERKLESDVGRLNDAVRAYRMNGGVLAADVDAAAVLAITKSRYAHKA
jgi:hypothetical protein